MRKKIDLTGQIFWKLIVSEEAGREKFGKILWLCNCVDGTSVTSYVPQMQKAVYEPHGVEIKAGTLSCTANTSHILPL